MRIELSDVPETVPANLKRGRFNPLTAQSQLETIWGHLLFFVTWILKAAIYRYFGCGSVRSLDGMYVDRPIVGCLGATFSFFTYTGEQARPTVRFVVC